MCARFSYSAQLSVVAFPSRVTKNGWKDCSTVPDIVLCVDMSGLDGMGLGGEASDALMDEVAQGDFGTTAKTLSNSSGHVLKQRQRSITVE